MTALPTPGFWKDKRVFLTGHTGFKGSWMSELLLSLGVKVYGFSLAPDTKPSLFTELGLKNRISSHEIGNIQDVKLINCALKTAEPDAIIHMAAQPIVSIGYEDPAGTFATNVMGTVNLLEAIRINFGDIPVIVVSSDKCYANNDVGRDFIEDDPLGGQDPYSASKAGTEIVCNSYRASFFSREGSARLASVRAGNVIGGGDWSANRLFPDLVRGFTENETILIRNPGATRPWQHVLEPLCGYLICAEAISKDRTNTRPWNFGPPAGRVNTVGEVVEVMEKIWNASNTLQIKFTENFIKEAQSLSIDSDAARRALRWTTQLDLYSTIKWTVEWYDAFYRDPECAKTITQKQLQDYADILEKS